MARSCGGVGLPFEHLSNVQEDIGQQGRLVAGGFDVGSANRSKNSARRRSPESTVKALVFYRWRSFGNTSQYQFYLISPGTLPSILHTFTVPDFINFNGVNIFNNYPLDAFAPGLYPNGGGAQGFPHTPTGTAVFCSGTDANAVIALTAIYPINQVSSYIKAWEWIFSIPSKSLRSQKQVDYLNFVDQPSPQFFVPGWEILSGDGDLFNSTYHGGSTRFSFDDSDGYASAPSPGAIPLHSSSSGVLWGGVNPYRFITSQGSYPVSQLLPPDFFSVVKIGENLHLYCLGNPETNLLSNQGRVGVKYLAFLLAFDGSSFTYNSSIYGNSSLGNVPDTFYTFPPVEDYFVPFNYSYQSLVAFRDSTPWGSDVVSFNLSGAVFAPLVEVIFQVEPPPP